MNRSIPLTPIGRSDAFQSHDRVTRTRAFIILTVIIVAGMLSRGIRGTPQFISKDVADALWAMAIYLLSRLCFPRPRIRTIASAATLLAFGIEFLKLYHAQWVEAIRDTHLGVILLGRYFHWADLLRCAVGIAFAMIADQLAISTRPARRG